MNTINSPLPPVTSAESSASLPDHRPESATPGRVGTVDPRGALGEAAPAVPGGNVDRASLQSAPDVGGTEPPFDEARVRALQAQVAAGLYVVDAHATAAAMLAQASDFHGVA